MTWRAVTTAARHSYPPATQSAVSHVAQSLLSRSLHQFTTQRIQFDAIAVYPACNIKAKCYKVLRIDIMQLIHASPSHFVPVSPLHCRQNAILAANLLLFPAAASQLFHSLLPRTTYITKSQLPNTQGLVAHKVYRLRPVRSDSATPAWHHKQAHWAAEAVARGSNYRSRSRSRSHSHSQGALFPGKAAMGALKEPGSSALMELLLHFVQVSMKLCKPRQPEGCVWRSVSRRLRLRVPADCWYPERRTEAVRHK